MRNATVEKSLEDMDRGGVAHAFVSLTTPGVWFGDPAFARKLARDWNEYAAKVVADHPGRFGFFAVLPLPDVEGSLREIEYALDSLRADGIGLYTSYQDRHLGDPTFAPILQELNRRKAVVYTHPVKPDCCAKLLPDVSEAMIEYGTDTTRTIASLVFSGCATRFSDMRLIFSHAGGTMPFLVGRFSFWAKMPHVAKNLPNGVIHELQRFFYDTAQSANRGAMSSLLELVETSQILFGTDFPFGSSSEHMHGLAGCSLSADDLRAIKYRNAHRLLTRCSP